MFVGGSCPSFAGHIYHGLLGLFGNPVLFILCHILLKNLTMGRFVCLYCTLSSDVSYISCEGVRVVGRS